MKLAIVGWRHYNDWTGFSQRVDSWIQANGRPSLIISGGAKGTDAMVEKYALIHKIPLKVYEANWKLHGKKAGPIRNALIVAEADHILAFLHVDSIGTRDCLAQADDACVPCTVVNLN
jgi:hypothetical protein